MTRWPRTPASVLLVAACTVASCGKAPPPPPAAAPVTIAAPAEAPARAATMTLVAAADVNPNAEARPSPVVVRIYQLRADGAFQKAEFLSVFDDEQGTLGAELITRDEFVLVPAETRTLAVTLAPETRFVGALAAFRDFRGSEWRAVIPAPRGGWTVSVAGTRVTLTAVE
jgi:type VI secretion system protein VasD